MIVMILFVCCKKKVYIFFNRGPVFKRALLLTVIRDLLLTTIDKFEYVNSARSVPVDHTISTRRYMYPINMLMMAFNVR